MRTLVRLLAISTVLLGGACAYLLWRPGDECAPAHDARAMQSQIDLLFAERARLRSELELTGRSAPRAPTPPASMTPARVDNAAGSAAVSLASSRPPGAGWLDRLTPEHRRTMVRERYGRLLYQELSLSDVQVDALLPVLVEQDDVRGTPRDNFGPRDTPEAREREREIAVVIGADKAAQFAEARSTIPARTHLRTMREDLERAGAPLSDAQNTALMGALKNFGLPKPQPSPPGETPQQGSERFRASRAEQQKHLRDLVAPMLTQRQLQRLDELDSMRAAMGMMPLRSN